MESITKNSTKNKSLSVVKITITHIDGSVDDMKLTFPRWTNWLEPHELAAFHLKELVYHLSRHFIRPSQFVASFGTINEDGAEHYSIEGFPIEIPLNKVYDPVKRGWVHPENNTTSPIYPNH